MSGYEASLGTILVGVLFNTFLYGIVTNQYMMHCQRFNGRRLIRLSMLFAYLLDTACSAMAIYTAWFFLITYYDDPNGFIAPVKPYEVFPAPTACSAFITQTFLTWRTWRLTRCKSLVVISTLLVISSLGLGIACGIKSTISEIIAGPALYRVAIIRTTWMISQAVADLFITTALCIVLLKARTGIKRTDSIIHRLIRGAVQTGVISVVFAIASLVTYLTWPETNISGMLIFPTGRIYTITLFNSLLSRQDAREGLQRGNLITADNKGGGLSTARYPQLTTAITITTPELDLESRGAEDCDDAVVDDSDASARERA